MKVAVLLTTIFALALGAHAQIFAGCGSIGVVGNLVTGVLGTVNSLLTTLLDGDGCNTQCAQLGYKYALFSQGLSLDLSTQDPSSLLGSCWCNNDGLLPRSVQEGTNPTGSCPTFITGVVGVKVNYVAATPVTFSNCVSSPTFSPNTDTVAPFTVSAVDKCFSSTQCATKAHIAVRAANVNELAGLLGGVLNLLLGTTGGVYECTCSNGAVTGTAVNCERETLRTPVNAPITGFHLSDNINHAYNIYNQVVATGALGRRELRQQAINNNYYCFQDLTACKIPGVNEYECLDIANDLESCGGCMYGQHGVNGTAVGVDCLSLPKVAKGRVSCVRGQCIATKCKRGAKLINGRCY